MPAIWGESQKPVAYERALVLTRQEPDSLSGGWLNSALNFKSTVDFSHRQTTTSQTMKTMLLIYAAEQPSTDSDRQECYAESTQLAHQLKATSVQVRNGKRIVTDGPFAETREQLGGYFLIDAKDLDEAIAIAGRIPAVRRETVEIRPVQEIPGPPAA